MWTNANLALPASYTDIGANVKVLTSRVTQLDSIQKLNRSLMSMGHWAVSGCEIPRWSVKRPDLFYHDD